MKKNLRDFLNFLQAIHVYGKKRLSTIRSYRPRKLPNGDIYVLFYDKRGKIVKPKHIPKIGRKSNVTKILRDIANGK